MIAHKIERIADFWNRFKVLDHESGHTGVVNFVVIDLIAVNHVGEHIDGSVAFHQQGMVFALGHIGFHNFLLFWHIAHDILNNVVQRHNAGQVSELIDHNAEVVLFLPEGVENVLGIRILGKHKRFVKHGTDIRIAVLPQFHKEVLDIQHAEVVFHVLVAHEHATDGEIIELLDELLLREVHINPLNFRAMYHDVHGAFVGEGENILVHLTLFLLDDIRFARFLDHIQEFVLGKMVLVFLNTQHLVYQGGGTGEKSYGRFEENTKKIHGRGDGHGHAFRFGKRDGLGNQLSNHDGHESDNGKADDQRDRGREAGRGSHPQKQRFEIG